MSFFTEIVTPSPIGIMDVASNLIRMYRNKTYQTDYSDFIEAIDDYHGQYNYAEKLKQ